MGDTREAAASTPYMTGEGTTWPNPTRLGEIGWRLRYAPESLTREDELVLASAVSAYIHLAVGMYPRKALARLRRLVRATKGDDDG